MGRRIAALQQQVLAAIARSGVYKTDGHANASIMVRHAANLSTIEGKRRRKAMRMLRDLPEVAAAFTTGRIGPSQVDRIARCHANERVREQLIEVDAHIATLAARLPYREFDAKLTEWERLREEDGTIDQAERNHEKRDYTLLANHGGSFTHGGGCGEVQGVEMKAILDAYIAAEFEADWAEARALHGDDATVEHLARTAAQRRADAVYAIYRAAADTRAAAHGGSRVVTNLIIDQHTFERELARFCGEDVEPDERLATFFDDLIADLEPLLGDADDPDAESAAPEPAERAPELDPEDEATELDAAEATPAKPPTYRCETLDGYQLTPTLVTARALLGHVRRGVMRSDGVTIDLGRVTRLFKDGAQLAVFLALDTCYWPGCNVPVSQCQADHLVAFNGPKRGPTNPDNGGPACGKHNRFKEHGYTVQRDEHGRLHVYRPDGTEIPYLP